MTETVDRTVAASGEQFPIRGNGYTAVVTECGATLRTLEHEGRPLVDGFPADAHASGGRGQLLLPWPNRVADGRYRFAGRDLQLPLTEPARGHASHGLVRWVSWSLEEHTGNAVALVYRLPAQPGYPWTLDLRVLYDLSADGLTATVTATNLSGSPAPYAAGAHPYLVAGTGRVDGWELTLPAAERVVTDERKIPSGREPVAGTPYDFRSRRPVGDLVVDHAYTGLERDTEGRVQVSLHDPASGHGVALWADEAHDWLQVYTGDELPEEQRRRSVAVEPMTAPANALATGEGLTVLAPAGEPGDTATCAWGIRRL